MLKQYIVLIIFALTSTFSVTTYADEEEQNSGPTFAYYTLAPDLTTNVYTKGKKTGISASPSRFNGCG